MTQTVLIRLICVVSRIFLRNIKMTYDNDYVEALKEQADLMAHHLQVVVEQSKCKGNLSREVVITNADQAVDNYFAMQQRFNSD